VMTRDDVMIAGEAITEREARLRGASFRQWRALFGGR
jgi:hypothetical protein